MKQRGNRDGPTVGKARPLLSCNLRIVVWVLSRKFLPEIEPVTVGTLVERVADPNPVVVTQVIRDMFERVRNLLAALFLTVTECPRDFSLFLTLVLRSLVGCYLRFAFNMSGRSSTCSN
jgi:hypothetical protein